ncbi:MAG TPA: 50S ribosomal protein L33 [Candidatus Hydrogenedens sp.]|nr:50S ribosomal protein L33 [Candidatus Hydrogenedens sp.]
MREQVILQCTECKRKNYTTTREKRKHPERLEIKKYCRYDRKHTVHREMK